MRASLNWLREFVNIDMEVSRLADLLTVSGLEVEDIEEVGRGLSHVISARVISVKKHPEADRLFICNVDTGKNRIQVLSSAPNLKEDMIVPLALPGTKLPGGGRVSSVEIRGYKSDGVLLAEDEMGLTDDHSGIMELPQEIEPGTPINEALPVEDHVLDIGLTPNRADCASIIGIAREISALTGENLKFPEITIIASDTEIEELADVEIIDTQGCPRYAAGMIQDIKLGPSPFWLRYRLHVSGIRGINNIVDITNYVMLEMGQPLHAFDYDRLMEHRIVVRKATDGEKFTTLDGKTHNLNKDVLLICDGKRPVALAGIMGGLNSEIFAGSKNVLIESAFFDPLTIRRGAKSLGISTEASYRFERGIDILSVPVALKRAMMLMNRTAGGKVVNGIIDRYPVKYREPEIEVRISRTNSVLGSSMPRDRICTHLRALNMRVDDINNDMIRVIPPSYRVDIKREIDVIEEVARLEGYDRIPVTYPPLKYRESSDPPDHILSMKIKDIMAGMGFSEIITYSFINPEHIHWMGADDRSQLRRFVHIMNPLTTDHSVMRTSLVPGMVSTIRTNINHGIEDLKLFEWGRVFFSTQEEKLPQEKLSLIAGICGEVQKRRWYSRERNADFYDIKGALETLLNTLNISDISFTKANIPPWYEKGQSAVVYLNETLAGYVGRLSQNLVQRFDLEDNDIYVFELDIEKIQSFLPDKIKYREMPKFPAVFRDLSILINKGIESSKVKTLIENTGGNLVESVEIYDLFEGGKIPPNEKAITFRITFRSMERTLDGKEVNELTEEIISVINKELGGRLREG